ncbi:MAG: beta-N-acetylhexosaminidase [Sedimentisphaerales bacterium]|nr:beta-N-acetylhexosaminidase [Sedimentisphaerales bacterium]
MVERVDGQFLPMVKEWQPDAGSMTLKQVLIVAEDSSLVKEAAYLEEILSEASIEVVKAARPDASPVEILLQCGAPELNVRKSDYRDKLLDQGYKLHITNKNITICSRTREGVFYGVQSLRQLLESHPSGIPLGIVRDWPDLPVRMIMLDLARQMEHPDYIRRVIDFCARYKLNALHLHLTDDENSCLYHEDYPWLMHPHALQADQVRALVEYAGRHHMEVIPEIESLGHSRVFIRHPQAGDILHQTKAKSLHAIPGYTNVLCPASPLTTQYLNAMYERCSELFPSDSIHIGCDEVNLAGCARCEAKWPDVSAGDQFLQHLRNCIQLAARKGKRTALWNDMFWRGWRGTELNIDIDAIVKDIPQSSVVIYDWHYHKIPIEITAKFKALGYDVIGCPALMSAGYMIYPNSRRLENVRAFAQVAREMDLLGLDSTIWLPQRYLTDAMWPGIAYAAAQSWAGDNTDDATFFASYLQNYHQSEQGDVYARIWRDLGRIQLGRSEITMACWNSESSLQKAAKQAEKKHDLYQEYLDRVNDIRCRIAEITPTISAHQTEWHTFDHAMAVLAGTIKRMLVAPQIAQKQAGYEDTLRQLIEENSQAVKWVTEDWDRNRFADDIIGKDNIAASGGQHLLHSLVLVQRYHQQQD